MEKETRDFQGPSHAARRLEDQIERHANLSLPLLIEGERGTGKRRAAKAVYRRSPWRERPLFEVDLADEEASLPPIAALLARGGLVILEEVGETTRAQQDRLLRWLRSFGEQRSSPSPLRVIATCTDSLGKLVAMRRFRADLFLRLRVATIEMPALAERREDIPHLVREFLTEIAGNAGESPKMLTAEAMEWALAFPWPGNVAQLRQEILRAAAAATSSSITREELRPDMFAQPVETEELCVREALSLQERIKEFERREILRTLQDAGGMRDQAAQILGMDRRTLQRKLRRWKARTVEAISPPGVS